MKKQNPFRLISFICLIGSLAQGATFYVWRDNPTPQEPYATWNTAATEIQQAVNFATNANDVVLVTNGVYNSGGTVTPGYTLTNRVCATNAITIRSVAADVTGAVIVGAAADGGGHGSNAVRCVYLEGGASLVGFTLTGGYTQTNRTHYQNCSAGGVFMNSGSIVSNCLIATNAAAGNGGGATCYYGGTLAQCEIVSNQTAFAGGGAFCAYGGVVNDCIIRDNIARSGNMSTGSGGGGVFCLSDHAKLRGSLLNNCVIYGNQVTGTGGGIHYSLGATRVVSCVITSNVAGGSAGGVYAWIGGSVSNCLVAHNRSNSSSTSAGGVYLYAGAVLEHSIIVDNYAHNVGGGVYNRNSTVNNCLIARNTAKKNGGGLQYLGIGTVKNCTIANNTVETANVGGGVSFDSVNDVLQNCIVWGNNASNIYYTSTPTISYTCSTPAPDGTENFADDPLFANTNRANYSLSGGSRCIDTGLFEPWMTTGFDLVGQPRIRQGGVDRGALEYLPKWTTIILR